MKSFFKFLLIVYIISLIPAMVVIWVNSPGKTEIRHYRQNYCDGDCGSDYALGRELWTHAYENGKTKISPRLGDVLLVYLLGPSVVWILVIAFSKKKTTEVKTSDIT